MTTTLLCIGDDDAFGFNPFVDSAAAAAVAAETAAVEEAAVEDVYAAMKVAEATVERQRQWERCGKKGDDVVAWLTPPLRWRGSSTNRGDDVDVCLIIR